MNGWDPSSLNNQKLTPLLLAIKKNQKAGIKDVIKINRSFKPNKSAKFDLNFIDSNTNLNILYWLLKHNYWDLAEDVFMNGGDAWITLVNGFKRVGFDIESFKIRYSKY